MRKFIFAFLFIIAGLSYLFKIDELLVEKFDFFNDLKISYIDKALNLSSSIEKHFDQANSIEKLKIENNELKEYKILYETAQSQLNTLKEFLTNVDIPENKVKIELVKVLSYINYNDFTKVWLDKQLEDEAILGLIADNYAAGTSKHINQQVYQQIFIIVVRNGGGWVNIVLSRVCVDGVEMLTRRVYWR